MWTRRSWFLRIKVRLKGQKPRLRIGVRMALYVPYHYLLSFDGALALLSGRARRAAMTAMNAAKALLLTLMQAEPQNYVHAEVQDGKRQVYVDVSTRGLQGEDGA